MGCAASVYAVGRRKTKLNIQESVVFVPSLWIPVHSDLQRPLRGLIPQDLINRLSCLRNQIVLVAEDTGVFSVSFCSVYCLDCEKMCPRQRKILKVVDFYPSKRQTRSCRWICYHRVTPSTRRILLPSNWPY